MGGSETPAWPFGDRISDEAFDRLIVALYAGLPPSPSRSERRRVRRAEFDLVIDHRLGNRFPAARRADLWAAQRRVNRRLPATILAQVASGWLRRSRPQADASLARLQVTEYAKVLTPRELRTFFADTDLRELLPDEQPE